LKRLLPLFLAMLASIANSASVNDVITSECKNLTNPFEDFPSLKEGAQDRCEIQQAKLLEEGKPNLVTHTRAEAYEYINSLQQNNIKKRRDENKDRLELIETKCKEVLFFALLAHTEREDGGSKSQAIIKLKTLFLEHPTDSLMENSVRSHMLIALRELHDEAGTWEAVGTKGANECKETLERVFGLR